MSFGLLSGSRSICVDLQGTADSALGFQLHELASKT